MKYKDLKLTIPKNEASYIIFILSSILIIIGIIFSYSLSVYIVENKNYSEFHFLIRQLIAGIIGISIMWIFSHFNADFIVKKIALSLFFIFGFLIIFMNFLPDNFTTQSGGANRWIRLPGFSISPVEFFKIGYLYFLSYSFDRKLVINKNSTIKNQVKLLLPYFFLYLLLVIVIAVFQKDFGNIVLLSVIMFTLLIFVNISWKILISLVSLFSFAFLTLILIAPHRIKRISSWWGMQQDNILSIFPQSIADKLRLDEFPKAEQVDHSLNAIYNGGFFGTGIGNGNLKLGFLPEVHTDFVLAGIGEEIGFIGLFFITSLIVILIYQILKVSNNLENRVYKLFTLSIALMISVTFCMNAFGIIGIIPIKGIAVPFLSYGGSSIISISICLGLVLSISRKREIDLLDER